MNIAARSTQGLLAGLVAVAAGAVAPVGWLLRRLASFAKGVPAYINNITERKHAENRQDLALQILATLNRSNGTAQLMTDVLHLIREETGIEAVGLRLRKGDDFPYYESNGFPESFVEAEQHLCARDKAGNVLRQADGRAVLECMCGNILCGRTDPNLPFFTAGGSFWTNCMTELLTGATEKERQTWTRIRCNSERYESVALLPLRSGGEIIGLWQLNDHRTGMFTLDRIRFFEEIGASIGIALVRQQTAEALHDSEVRYRRLFEAAKDGILILDAETGMVMDANPFLLDRLGFSHAQVFGRKVWELGPLKDVLSNQTSFLKLQQEGYVRYESLPLETADGRRMDVEFVSNVYLVDHHRVIQCNIRDITERRRTEEEIKKRNAELEQHVLERTAELTAVNKELEAFTYSISHDLRAPLRHLTGFAELLQKDAASGVSDKARRHLAFISESAQRMANLIDDLLAFSRSGRTELRREPVSLDALVKDVIGGLDADTQGRRVCWDIGPLPVVHADPALLRAVLANLINNALKFTRGRIEARVQIGCNHNDGEMVFFIRDNGVGFDMKYVDKLFGMFQRLHSLDQFEGNGIGLANVRRVISRHGGRTWAEGAVNAGATFYFSLPQSTERKVP